MALIKEDIKDELAKIASDEEKEELVNKNTLSSRLLMFSELPVYALEKERNALHPEKEEYL